MGCLFALLALITPRVVIVLVWLFTHWFRGVFDTVLWPLLGFIFLPTTLLWYTAVQHWFGGQWTLGPVVGLVIALAIDVSPARRRRRRG
jgi:ABC-type amino acid transport system permease subunit